MMYFSSEVETYRNNKHKGRSSDLQNVQKADILVDFLFELQYLRIGSSFSVIVLNGWEKHCWEDALSLKAVETNESAV